MADLKAERKYDFEVVLNTLRGGYGNCQQFICLYFDYKVQFWSFVESLRSATMLSTIPPVDLTKQYSLDEEMDFSRSTSSQGSNSNIVSQYIVEVPARAGSVSSKVSRENLDESSRTALKFQDDQESRITKSRGYTLEHGAWLWHDKSKGIRQWREVTDVSSFKKMIAYVEAQSTSNGGSHPAVVLAHVGDF